MRRKIRPVFTDDNGKVYDTTTAKRIAYYDNMKPAKDPLFLSEEVFKKRNGEFFVYIQGGSQVKINDEWKVIPKEDVIEYVEGLKKRKGYFKQYFEEL